LVLSIYFFCMIGILNFKQAGEYYPTLSLEKFE